MKTKPKILILTSTYPFGKKGDHFIESELSNLQKEFELEILPLHKIKTPPVFTDYLESFHSHSGLIESTNWNRANIIASLFFLIRSPFFLIKLFFLCIKEIFNNVFFNPKQNLFLYAYLKIFDLPRENVPYRSLFFQIIRKSMAVVLVLSWFRRRKMNMKSYSLIYSYWSNDFALALSLWGLKTKICTRFHGYDLYKERQRNHFFPFRETFLKNIQRGLFVNEKGRDYLLKNYKKINSERLKVNYLGSRAHRNAFSYRTDKTLVVCSASNIEPVKQVHLIPQALSQLKCPFHWHHFGDGSCMEQVRTLTCDLLSEDQFTFTGNIPHHKIFQKIQDIRPSLFINSSSSEGLPISILEALSFGIPVIAPDIGGVSEAVQSHFNGYLLDNDFSTSQLTQVINDFVLLSAQEKLKLSKNALELWNKKFNSDKCSLQLLQEFNQIIEGK